MFDVGANRGQFAQRLRQIGYRGWIVSFEPNRDLLPLLERLSARDPRWRILPLALGDSEGTQTLHVSGSDDLASVLTINDYARQSLGTVANVVRDTDVDVQRLDTVYPALRQELGFARPFLKIDTQGYDLNVFRGAEGCWPDLAGLITEMSLQPLYDGMPDLTESLRAIRAAGFDVTGLFRVVSDSSMRLIEVDCVARRVPGSA